MAGKKTSSKDTTTDTTGTDTSVSLDTSVDTTDQSLSTARDQLSSSSGTTQDSTAPSPDTVAQEQCDIVKGGKLTELVGKYLWRDTGPARTAIEAPWVTAFVEAFKQLTEGSAKTKRKKAAKTAESAVAGNLRTLAVQEAKDRAAADIQSGAAFGGLDQGAQTAKDDYDDGSRGAKALELSAELGGLKAAEQKTRCDQEVPPATYQSSPLSVDKDQHVYTFPDGSMIRLKPDGDMLGNSDAMYSIEVMKDGESTAADQSGIAFKVSADGKPVPKGPDDVNNPYSYNKGYQQYQAEPYLNTVMSAGHLFAAK